jgi:molecular chaperone GrpE
MSDERDSTPEEAAVQDVPGAGEPENGAPEPDADADGIVIEPDDRAALEQKLAEQHERLLRTAAELDNVRKRARRDAEDAVVRGRAEVLGEVLPALDSLDIALSSATATADAESLVQGMELVRRQFLSGMERFGLKPIEAAGRPFDPAVHEAVAQLASDEVAAGEVLEDMRRGYLLGERLLRASMVVVSAGPAPAPAGAAPEADPEPAAAPGEGGGEA